MIVDVPGKAYIAGMDPNATGVPREEGWPTPTVRRHGRGFVYRYDVTPQQAAAMADHLQVLGESLMYADVEDRVEARACLAAAARIRTVLSKAWEPVYERVDGTGKIIYWRLMHNGKAVGAVSRKPEGWRALGYGRNVLENRELGMHESWRAARRAVERAVPN